MQLIDLGKLRFNFAGEWLNTAVYETNDVVKYGGNVYVYTYALKTSANLPTDTGYWALMVEGFKFKGVYSAATQYRIGDGVAHGGKVYIAIKDGTAQTPPNEVFWSQFADGIQYEGTYSNTGQYQKNDVVMYGGSVYIAKQDTTGNLPSAGAFWGKFVEGISPKGVYNAATAYVEGDLAAYGANLYRAKGDTTGNLPTVTANWELLLSGFTFLGNWSAGSAYKPNEIVQYGGNSYVALLAHASMDFATDLAAARWQKFNSGIRWRGPWTATTSYLPDDIVTDGINTLIAKSAFTSGIVDAVTDGIDPTANAKWGYLAKGATGIPLATVDDQGKMATIAGGIVVLRPYTLRGLFAATQF